MKTNRKMKALYAIVAALVATVLVAGTAEANEPSAGPPSRTTAGHPTQTVAMSARPQASAKKSCSTNSYGNYTLSGLRCRLTGANFGPSSNTHGGRATIKGFPLHCPSNCITYDTNLSATHPDPTVARGETLAVANGCSWYQLTCWGWSSLIGGSWSKAWGILGKCAIGGLKGTFSFIGGKLATRVLSWAWTFFKSAIKITQAGAAASFVVGCIFAFRP